MNSNLKNKTLIVYGEILLSMIMSILFVQQNFYLYDQPIAEVMGIELTNEEEILDSFGNTDKVFE